MRQVFAFVALQWPVPEGGELLVILDKTTGEAVGELRQRFANEFYDAKIREDLLILSANEFAARWITGLNT